MHSRWYVLSFSLITSALFGNSLSPNDAIAPHNEGERAWSGEDRCFNQEVESDSDTCCSGCVDDWDIWIYPDYLYLGYTGGRGISYRKGLTTLGIFLTPWFLQTPCLRTFLDAKGFVFSEGKWASSAGIGTRFILPSRDLVIGANIYFDYRRFHRFNLYQIGVGLEILGPSWDLRLNGYVPASERNFREGRLFDFSNGVSSQVADYFFAIRRRRASAWYGVDGEFGTWLKRKDVCDWWGLYAAAGFYYYFREHVKHFEDGRRREAFGGKIRFLARIWDMLDVSLTASYDPKWHTNVQGQIALVIPLDIGRFLNQKCPCGCRPSLLEQIADQPVQRNGIIVADRGRCCWLRNWSNGSGHGRSANRPNWSPRGCRGPSGSLTAHSMSASALGSLLDSSSSRYFSSSSSFSHLSSSMFHHRSHCN